MKRYLLSHLSNHEVRTGLYASITSERAGTAQVLAHIAEFDERKLYLPEAYPSMRAYCLGALHFSEDAAYKRIQAARAARVFPVIFDAIEDGRLHLTAVVRLAPHLSPGTAAELLAAAAHKTTAEIELLLAERFPRPDTPACVRALEPQAATDQPAAASGELVLKPVPSNQSCSVACMEPLGSGSNVSPLSPGRFALELTMDAEMHDDLCYAQALLGHAIPSQDIVLVVRRGFKALIRELERSKLARVARSRPSARGARSGSRHIAARVRRAVWLRDGGQCTFVSESGRRCEARTRLEFHHVVEFARGGEATIEGIRLRCRAHNQYEAERAFGAEFMRGKRAAAAEARAVAKARTAAACAAATADEQDPERSVVPWLRSLGLNLEDARRAAARCEDIPNATLEERMRRALSAVKGQVRQVIALDLRSQRPVSTAVPAPI